MPDFFLSCVFGEHKLQLNSLLLAAQTACTCFEKKVVTLHKIHSFLIHYSLQSSMLSFLPSVLMQHWLNLGPVLFL